MFDAFSGLWAKVFESSYSRSAITTRTATATRGGLPHFAISRAGVEAWTVVPPCLKVSRTKSTMMALQRDLN